MPSIDETLQFKGTFTTENEKIGHTIWGERYPLIRSTRNKISVYSKNRYAKVRHIYRNSSLAFGIVVFSLSILCLLALVLCKLLFLPSTSIFVQVIKFIWYCSPLLGRLVLLQVAQKGFRSQNILDTFGLESLNFLNVVKLDPCLFMSMLLLASYMIPFTCACLAYAVPVTLNIFDPINDSFVKIIGQTLNLPSRTSTTNILALYFFNNMTIGIFWDMFCPSQYDFGYFFSDHPMGCSWILYSIVEEIGWSGALFPALLRAFPNRKHFTSILTGVIWSLWHIPMIIGDQYQLVPLGTGYSIGILKAGSVYDIVAFFFVLIASRMTMCLLQGDSCRIWSSVIYHSSFKMYVISMFGQLSSPLVLQEHLERYFISETSLSLVFTTSFVAIVLCISGIKMSVP